MILGRRQGDDRAAVGDGQHAGFLAVEPLFDDELIAGVAEFLVASDPPHGFDGFGSARADEHAFAGGQSVGLDHDRHVLAVGEISGGVIGVAKDVIVAGRDVGVAQQVLAEDLAPFQLGGRLVGTEDAQLGGLKGVDQAADQGHFRADDGQLDVVLLGELDEPRDVGGRNVDIFRVEGRAGIARRDEDASHSPALAEFPCQRMLAPAIADYQHVHTQTGGKYRGDFGSQFYALRCHRRKALRGLPPSANGGARRGDRPRLRYTWL